MAAARLHVGIIPDGNRRFAREHGFVSRVTDDTPSLRPGAITLLRTILWFILRPEDIHTLTVYILSEDNWKRSTEELTEFFDILREFINYVQVFSFKGGDDDISVVIDRILALPVFLNVMYGCSSNINITEIVSEIEKVAATATASPLLTLPIVRVCTTDFSRVPEDVISIVREMNVLADRVAATAASGDGASGRRQINICFSYSGQADIARAATLAVADIARAATLAVVTPTDIESRLLIQGGPFDLIIRTSGEQRISDFGIWHASRAELIFLKKLWPEIRPDDLDQCIQEFRARDRRLGK